MKGKERNIKYLFVLLISIITLLNANVYAYSENAQGGVTTDGVENCGITYNGECHKDYNIEVVWNGKSYTGYCADFNGHLGGLYNSEENHSYQCTEMNDATIGYILGSSLPASVKEAALRATQHTNYQIGGSLAGDVQNLVQNAYTGATGSLTFTQAGINGATITYNVSSPTALTNVNFTCDANCTMGEHSWNGTSGTVTVTAKNGCTFTITATYDGAAGTGIGGNANVGSRILKCEWNQKQTLYVALDEGSNGSGNGGAASGASGATGKVSQKFTGSITSGPYYEEYCKNDNDKCNEITTLEKPQYCDVSGNEIKITAPTNVKYCILNSNDDAGNTYQDTTQVKESNSYCAIYCKEDYTMTLPGAKYTDSGRYFELENTIVEAERTCYATNSDSDPEKGINIEKFIEDIKKAQEDLRDAYNAYKKAKREKELADAAVEQHGRDCDGNESGTYKKIPSDQYEGIELYGYNSNTGEYRSRITSMPTEEHTWGNKGYCEQVCDHTFTLLDEDCHPESKLEQYESFDPDAALRSAESSLNAAENNLKARIEEMEACYNWTNTLCLNPEVVFNYNEQYNTDINYELVDGGGTFEGTNATYHSGETIDEAYTANEPSQLENPAYVNCTTGGCETKKTEKGISTLDKKLFYRKIITDGKAQYANTQNFATNYPHGTIDKVSDPSAVRHNYSYLGAYFPVALNTPTGVYKWTLDFNNLGMYNDDACRNGRLNEVLAANGQNTSTDIEYVCVYVVDCDDCDYECVGDYCYHDEEPKCPECEVYCENCIFDGEITFSYELVSVNDMNPNERQMGSNWTSEKGQKALSAIEETGESAYENAQYVITLNPENMKEIRDYNKSAEVGENYVSKDLDYHTKDGITNAYGTSSFLRDEKNQRKFFKEIKLNDDWELWTSVDKENNVGPAYK